MTPLPETTDVVIVGAGPSGLAAALSIKAHSTGTTITVVDALPARENESRGLIINAQTLQALKDVDPEAAELIQKGGIPASVFTIQNEKRTLVQLEPPKSDKMTNSPFVLQIAQWKAEAILTKVLEAKGVTVARPHRATGIVPFYGEEGQEDTPQEYKFVLTFEDGKTMKAKYVIGADGKESMIRGSVNLELLELPTQPRYTSFLGRGPGLISLADVQFTPDTSPSDIALEPAVTFGSNGLLFLAPAEQVSQQDEVLTEKARTKETLCSYRMVFPLTTKEGDMYSEERTTVPFLQERMDRLYRRIPSPPSSTPPTVKLTPTLNPHTKPTHRPEPPKPSTPQIASILWHNTLPIKYRISTSFVRNFDNDGYVLLVGEAAHVHSPSGIQSMNLGICDGLEAGSAIAAAILTGKEEPMLEYGAQRRKFVDDAIRRSRRVVYFSMLTGWRTWLRDSAIRIAGKSRRRREKVAWEASGLKFPDNTSN